MSDHTTPIEATPAGTSRPDAAPIPGLRLDRRGTSRRESTEPPALSTDEWDALDGMARTLTGSGWYRVVRRFERRDRYGSPSPAGVRYGLYVDVETTGLDTANDHIIELALVRFEFDADGRVYGVDEPIAFLEDPGVPIPPEVTHITGIDDEMVRGQRIDDDRVHALIGECALVVAHNVSFDRQMLERRLPAFADTHWACSQREVPWREFGAEGVKLEYLLYRICAEFHSGHRGVDDCMAGVHLLAHPELAGRTALSYLLESARQTTQRVWAVGATFEQKDVLKARGYRYNGGPSEPLRTWYCEVDPGFLDAELQWLDGAIYRGKGGSHECTR